MAKKEEQKSGQGNPGGGKVLKCELCNNDSPAAKYQDKKYGKGMRVMNYAMRGRAGQGAYRCTVCGKERP